MIKLPGIVVRGIVRLVILIQGGMGAMISLATLAGAVARRGGIGVVSAVGLKIAVSARVGRQVSDFEAAKLEIEEAIRLSGGKGRIYLNCMWHMHTTLESIRGAIAGGVHGIIVGAGIARTLADMPEIEAHPEVALVPIVSSARVLELLCRSWKKHPPDAVVVEGPQAGGHLGYSLEQIEDPAYQLEAVLPAVLEVSKGSFPVIVAGGIWDRDDIVRMMEAGADGVQMGTPFLATHESGASAAFKEKIMTATADDILVAADPGSPARMPIRILASSPGYQDALKRRCTDEKLEECIWGYMLNGGKCDALDSPKCFCICKALVGAVNNDPNMTELPIYTVGANVWRVKKRGILSVDELMNELTGFKS